MAEKSGIELLEEIVERLALLEKKIDLIDRNVKLLSNTTKPDRPGVGAIQQSISGVKDEIKKVGMTGFKNFKFEQTDASKANPGDILARRAGQGAKHVVVKGKMVAEVDGKAVPLSSVSVKIYNDRDALIKETRTNRAGHWVSHLPPGKYVALFEGELNGKKLLPQNRNFIVPEGQVEFEVS